MYTHTYTYMLRVHKETQASAIRAIGELSYVPEDRNSIIGTTTIIIGVIVIIGSSM